MVKIHISDLAVAFQESNILWILIPIFFVGIITDKYQEEFGTSLGNAISNGALIIFTAFSWLQLISTRGQEFPIDVTISQLLFTLFIILYGFAIVASGFESGKFARKYGRIRVITFMLMFFTIMVYIPYFYNFISILIFVLLFPLYYALITHIIKILPSAATKNIPQDLESNLELAERKLKKYLK